MRVKKLIKLGWQESGGYFLMTVGDNKTDTVNETTINQQNLWRCTMRKNLRGNGTMMEENTSYVTSGSCLESTRINQSINQSLLFLCKLSRAFSLSLFSNCSKSSSLSLWSSLLPRLSSPLLFETGLLLLRPLSSAESSEADSSSFSLRRPDLRLLADLLPSFLRRLEAGDSPPEASVRDQRRSKLI